MLAEGGLTQNELFLRHRRAGHLLQPHGGLRRMRGPGKRQIAAIETGARRRPYA